MQFYMRSSGSRRWLLPALGLVAMTGAIGGLPSREARADPAAAIDIKAELAHGTLVSGITQKTYLRIAVTPARRDGGRRALMNIALVIDRSGSMSAHGRMENARRAAQMAVDRLGREDILSVVSYDDKVEVDVPATKVIDPQAVKDRIQRLGPRGSTAIHAGLIAAANEVRKFKSRDRVNRIVLLSDGLANVGPSKPADFVSLGRELAAEGITVSTIGLGLGYNEDLMAGLARSADGGHVFVQESADLAAFLAREFDDAQGIVGQEVEIIIRTKAGVRPLRSLGREAQIRDGQIAYKVGTLIAGVEQVLLAEIEIDVSAATGEGPLAEIGVAYSDAASGERRTRTASASVSFGADRAKSEASLNANVMRDVVTLESREARQEAIKLRDAGRAEEARAKFDANATYLRKQQEKLPGSATYAPLLDELKANTTAASPAAQSSEGWAKARKQQRETDSNKAGSGLKF